MGQSKIGLSDVCRSVDWPRLGNKGPNPRTGDARRRRPRGVRPAAGREPGGRCRWRRAYSRSACAENLIPKVSAPCSIPTGFVVQLLRDKPAMIRHRQGPNEKQVFAVPLRRRHHDVKNGVTACSASKADPGCSSEVDPGNGTSGLIGNGAVSVVVDGDDDEEAETED